ncbi:MAG: DNA polymerase I [Ignavibacteria bacterium]|jgi:DNA polymerase-1|nr:DNA polymerase I [Ignavibacteria bacterium]MCU7501583.1 DNA polymerase I [Ignavibacteria bacterium]MCU7517120.1 DNA polymerase I [Ignavibacteria bacterium]
MEKQKKKFVIVDAMALAYKAYFAFMGRPLATTKGEPTSAVFGFISQLLKILESNKPDYIAVAFDSKEKTFRHERYDQYKSTRLAMPEDMITQMQRIKEVVDAFNIPIYIVPGYEADDIIGTAVKKAEEMGLESFAITPDKDFNQIVTPNIKVIKPGKTTEEIVVIDEAKIKEDFGFEPIQMIDYLALIGDKSDNIPGVAGIGPVGALPLIHQYKTVEGIYENIEKIDKPALKRKLIEGRDNAFLSKELATIHTSVPFECDITKAEFRKPDLERLKKIFEELEFRNFFARVEKVAGGNGKKEDVVELTGQNVEAPAEAFPEIPQPEVTSFNRELIKYHLMVDKKGAEELASKLSKTEMFVFDTETDSLNCFDLNLAGVSFSTKPKEAYFVAVNPFTENGDLFQREVSNRLSIDEFVRIFKPVFENGNIKKICQNGKFDIATLRKYGIEVRNFYFDTMIASYVLDPDQKHGLDDLSVKYLNYKPIPLTTLIGNKKDAARIFEAPISDLAEYSCEDSDVTYRLYKILDNELKENNLEELCRRVEFPLVEVLEDMEREGVRIDTNILKVLSNDLQILLDNYSKKIFDLAGEEFNVNSPLQLQKVLYSKLGLATGKKTKTGFSTDAHALEALKGSHEIIDLILDYRQVSKLKSTYTDALPALIHPVTGRIHTSFNQTITSTGRLSSNNPNLQNIPIRTEMGKEIRRAFVPRNKDYVLLSADYSQIELRIMASICKDPALCDAFRNAEDIHRSTAALVFRVDPSEVTSDMRRRAKEVNFGILYGIGSFGLKTRLGVTQAHAKKIIDTYFSTFSMVNDFMESSVRKAREKGYAETLLGRRRYLKNINSKNRVVRQFEERVAINMPIQGTAADMIKLAMIRIYEELKKRNTRTKMVLQVHDELLFDAHKDEVDELRPLIKELMENALPMDVPIIAETGVAENWLDAH